MTENSILITNRLFKDPAGKRIAAFITTHTAVIGGPAEEDDNYRRYYVNADVFAEFNKFQIPDGYRKVETVLPPASVVIIPCADT